MIALIIETGLAVLKTAALITLVLVLLGRAAFALLLRSSTSVEWREW